MERERGKHTEKDGAKKDEGKKDEGKKEEGKKDDGRKIKRVIGRVEADLRILDSDMRQLYNRSALHTLALMVAVYWAVSSHYAGAAVATLPFTPYVAFDFAERPKPTDCSVFFLFVLCSMTFRPNLQKMLGFAPPKSVRAAIPPPPFPRAPLVSALPRELSGFPSPSARTVLAI